jgi:AmiR/NasT family two-component response regulator
MNKNNGGVAPGRPEARSLGLANLDLVVLTARDEVGEPLIRDLQRRRARVRHVWPIPELLPGNADVVLCDLIPGLASRLPWIPGKPTAALIVLIPSPAAEIDLEQLRKCSPHAVLHSPYGCQAVLAAVTVARSQFAYEARLRSRIDKLDENLRVIRAVERAKSIMMDEGNMREEEAYQFLRTQAMARGVSIGTVAAAVMESHRVLRVG